MDCFGEIMTKLHNFWHGLTDVQFIGGANHVKGGKLTVGNGIGFSLTNENGFTFQAVQMTIEAALELEAKLRTARKLYYCDKRLPKI